MSFSLEAVYEFVLRKYVYSKPIYIVLYLIIPTRYAPMLLCSCLCKWLTASVPRVGPMRLNTRIRHWSPGEVSVFFSLPFPDVSRPLPLRFVMIFDRGCL